MAVEVDHGTYIYGVEGLETDTTPVAPESVGDIINDITTGFDSESSSDSQQSDNHQKPQQTDSSIPTTRTTSSFRYNPTHDLESLFWIALYFVVNKEAQPAASSKFPGSSRIMQSHTSNTPDHQSRSSPQTQSPDYKLDRKQRALAKDLFYDRSERVMVLLSGNRLRQNFQERPKPLSEIGGYLCDLRDRLQQHYITIEKPGYQIDKSVCGNTGLYTAFKAYFKKIVNKTEDVIVSPLLPDLDTDGVLPSASRSRSTTALLVKFNDTMKRKAAYEAGSTSAPPFSKKWKPSDASE